MRIGIRRLLVLGGGAAILGTAGFAYMASNTIPNTAAGESVAAVSGYTVTGVTYNHASGSGCGGPCYINSVQFTLTSDDPSAQNNGKPDFVYVAVQTGTTSGELANADGCTIPAGTVTGGVWSGNFDCALNPTNGATVEAVKYLNIAATQ